MIFLHNLGGIGCRFVVIYSLVLKYSEIHCTFRIDSICSVSVTNNCHRNVEVVMVISSMCLIFIL